jgi:hypothetical protein
LNKVIYYIGFYSPSNQELIIENRTFSSAAVNLMNFVSNQLSINCNVHILSPAWSLHTKGFYSGKNISITKNVFLHLTPSFGSVYKIGKIFSKAFAELWLLGKIILMVKENDKLIAYHSIANSLTILLARKIIGFTLVLQLNEIYQDVENLGRFNNYIENKIISRADSFILSTKQLSNRIATYNKEYVVCEGVLSMNQLSNNKYNDGKIHLVYAGLIDKIKFCAFNSINLAPFLTSEYLIHIAGFGTEDDLQDLMQQIVNSNLLFPCKIVYQGFLQGEELNNLLQQCHIGLVAQSQDQAFTNSSFPSKIYTYLTNNLEVVCLQNSLIDASPVADLLYTYDDNNPKSIAELIKNLDISINRFILYKHRLDEINALFINRLNLLLA